MSAASAPGLPAGAPADSHAGRDRPLPQGWSVHVSSRTGNTYWFHAATNTSSYTFPGDAPAPAGAAAPAAAPAPAPAAAAAADVSLPPGWARHVSTKTGLPYYYHAGTGVSRYDPPPLPGAADAADAAADEAAAAPPPPAAAAGDAAAAAVVASAYDALQDRGRDGRQASAILHLKNLNNWVKATLVASTAPRPAGRVLDLACGKLGDLQKWRLAGVHHYAGVDISRGALDDAAARLRAAPGGGPGGGLVAKLARADLGAVDLAAAGFLAPGEQFDAVSMQFAIHYLFATEARALTLLRNLAGRLAPGGVFIGTLPDADVLVRRVRALSPGGPPPPGGELPPAATSFGNRLFRVAFTPASAAAVWRLGAHPFGVRYTFFLTESVESVDEYLVPPALLERCARAVGLEPLLSENFHDFFERHTRPDGEGGGGGGGGAARAAEAVRLLGAMNVLDAEGTLTPDEWEVAGLYRVFAFRAPLAGAVVSPDLPPMAAIHPEWAAPGGGGGRGAGAPGAAASGVRAQYRRYHAAAPSDADVVDLIGGGA